jgi:hypothetical protein
MKAQSMQMLRLGATFAPKKEQGKVPDSLGIVRLPAPKHKTRQERQSLLEAQGGNQSPRNCMSERNYVK